MMEKRIKMPNQDDKKIYFRTITRSYYDNYTLKHMDKNKIKGRILNLPKESIGELCIIVPINKSQQTYFYEKTIGYDRVRRYIKSILRNPREMLK